MRRRVGGGRLTDMTTITVTTDLPSGTWHVDPVHSTVGFAVRHMLVSTFRGRFEAYDARLVVGDDGSAELVGTVEAASISVKDPALATHLVSPEFFDAEQYPQLVFHSSAVRRDGDRLELDGTLTIKGRTLAVTARGTVTDAHEDPFGGVRMGLELETIVDRRQFGLDWNMPLPKGGFALDNEVRLQIALEFTQA
jgi:polyisoprenoid-binding protein YceI